MKGKWSRYKVVIIAAGLVLCMTGLLGAGMGWFNKKTMNDVVEAAAKEVEEPSGDGIIFYERWDDDALYKEYEESFGNQEIAKQVCKKFGLDYDTVTRKEITREMYDYGEALQLLRDIGANPLYNQYAEVGEEGYTQESLESYICDVYAFSEGRTVIGEYCREKGINPEKAVVSDFTVDELIEIGQRAFEASDHGTEAEKERLEERLYQEYQRDSEIAKKVCERYDLDYDTVTVKELTQEMRNYEDALWLLKNLGKSTLYEEHAQRDGSKITEWTLEAYIRDKNELPETKKVIEAFCSEKEIDPNTAIISDFTEEELLNIIERAYETADQSGE